AQVAHQQAKYLVKALPRALVGKPVRAFRYRDMGALVSLADSDAFGSLGQFGLFHGQTFRGRLAQISHVMLYRSHQARIHGFWRGGLLWLVDRLNARVRAPIRLDCAGPPVDARMSRRVRRACAWPTSAPHSTRCRPTQTRHALPSLHWSWSYSAQVG